MSDDDPRAATGTASEAEPLPALPFQKETEPDWAKTENEADPKEAMPMQKPAPAWAQTVPAPPGETLDEAPEIAHVRSIPDQEDVAPAPSTVPEATDIWPPDPPTEHTMPAWPPSSSLRPENLPAPSTIPSSTEPWADSFDGVAASGTKPSVPPAQKTSPPAAAKPPAETAPPAVAPVPPAVATVPPAKTVPPAAATVPPAPAAPPAVNAPPAVIAPTVPPAASTPPPTTVSPAPPADHVWGSVAASAPAPEPKPVAAPEPVAPPEKPAPPVAAAPPAPLQPAAPSQPPAAPFQAAANPAAPSIDWPDAVPVPSWAPRIHIGSTRTDEWTPASQPVSPAPQPAPRPAPQPAVEKAPAASQPGAQQSPAAQPAAHAPAATPAATPTGTPTKGWSWGIVEQKKGHEPAKVSPTPEDRSYAEWFAWAKRGGAPAGACHAAAQGAFQALASGKDVATAVKWATAAMTKPPVPVSADRQAYCAWFSLANIDLNLDQHKAHAFATAAVHALDAGADAARAHAAGLAAAGVR